MRPNLLLPVAVLLSAPAFGQDPALEDLPAAKQFESHRITSADPTGGNADRWDIGPGQTRVLAEIQGPGRIVHFRDNITSREPHHLQLHVLRIYWDGEKQPSVEVPVGDFFGVGFGFTERFSSALMCIDQRPGEPADPAAMGAARNCYIPMPFAGSARITLTNEGKQSSRHWFEINYRTYKKPPPDQLYFHAQYRQGTPPPEGPYLILDAKGRGHLVGCVLSVKNNDGGWWGEGDEIAWIDGEHAMQGTGSEDYFCQSYGLRAGCFPYFGVTLLAGPFTTAYRWHVPDPVAFGRSLRLLIEQGNGRPPFRSGNDYYSVAYWYQTEPHAPFPKLPSAQQRIGWAAGAAEGALEGERMKVLSRTGGTTEIQTQDRWSGSRQLWWRDAKVGDTLELALPVAEPGRYRLVMRNTLADDYGIFRFRLDGEELTQRVDFYSAANVTRLTTLGERDLTPGEHRLTVEVVGANPAAKPRHMLGLDYVRLETVR
jgi:hypothetical protein